MGRSTRRDSSGVRALSEDGMEQAGMGVGVGRFNLDWGSGIVDLDDDGPPDPFVANGSVHPRGRAAFCDTRLRRPG